MNSLSQLDDYLREWHILGGCQVAEMRATSSTVLRPVLHFRQAAQCSIQISPNNLHTDGFTLKLNGFGKFFVRHKPGILRKIGYTGETIQTKALRKVKFISLGPLRRRERVG